MSRARDRADGVDLSTYAPLASPAFTGTPTGITASHITTGTLGNTVQDNITRLGTVTEGSLSLSTDEIVGLASSVFNGVGIILGCSYATSASELEPGNTNWHEVCNITHSLRHSSHYLLGIGVLCYSSASSRGQMSLQAFKPGGSTNFDSGQKISQGSSGAHSLRNDNSNQVGTLAPYFAMWKPGNTDANVYKLMMAEEGGSNFRANMDNASQSWMIIFECTGVA